jgi:hypothetical protein
MEQDKPMKNHGKSNSGIPLTVHFERTEILSMYMAGCSPKVCKTNMSKILLLLVVVVVVAVILMVIVVVQ